MPQIRYTSEKSLQAALETISKAKTLQDYLPGIRPVSFPAPPVFERTNSPFVNRCIHKHPKQLTIGEFSLYPISDESSVPQLNTRIISQSKSHCKEKIPFLKKNLKMPENPLYGPKRPLLTATTPHPHARFSNILISSPRNPISVRRRLRRLTQIFDTISRPKPSNSPTENT